jgi:SPP1 family predicted phage head-tail adaptor
MSLASKLKHRIALLQLSSDVDEAGQPLETWHTLAHTWAFIQPLRGRELFAAQQSHSEVTTRITIRYRDDVDSSMIARYQGTDFEILYIIHTDYAKKELQMMCRERQ